MFSSLSPSERRPGDTDQSSDLFFTDASMSQNTSRKRPLSPHRVEADNWICPTCEESMNVSNRRQHATDMCLICQSMTCHLALHFARVHDEKILHDEKATSVAAEKVEEKEQKMQIDTDDQAPVSYAPSAPLEPPAPVQAPMCFSCQVQLPTESAVESHKLVECELCNDSICCQQLEQHRSVSHFYCNGGCKQWFITELAHKAYVYQNEGKPGPKWSGYQKCHVCGVSTCAFKQHLQSTHVYCSCTWLNCGRWFQDEQTYRKGQKECFACHKLVCDIYNHRQDHPECRAQKAPRLKKSNSEDEESKSADPADRARGHGRGRGQSRNPSRKVKVAFTGLETDPIQAPKLKPKRSFEKGAPRWITRKRTCERCKNEEADDGECECKYQRFPIRANVAD